MTSDPKAVRLDPMSLQTPIIPRQTVVALLTAVAVLTGCRKEEQPSTSHPAAPGEPPLAHSTSPSETESVAPLVEQIGGVNLAKYQTVTTGTASGDKTSALVTDGDVSTLWQSSGAGPHEIIIVLPIEAKISAAHLFFGDGDGSPPPDPSLDWWDGNDWQMVPGAHNLTENQTSFTEVRFRESIKTNRIRLRSRAAKLVVREIALFAASESLTAYPLGTDVFRKDLPTARWSDYSDSYWQLANDGLGTLLTAGPDGIRHLLKGNSIGQTQQFQILYNYANDTFRIRNRETLKCLAAKTLDLGTDAEVVEGDYHAMPHETWRLETSDGDLLRIVNAWSGQTLVAEASGKLVLQPIADDPRQFWRAGFQAVFPKKGLADVRNDFKQFHVSWEYNWSREPRVGAVPPDIAFCPMWWNTQALETHPLFYSLWQKDARPIALLGFNEPDLAIESNMTPEQAVAAWPMLEASDLPLLSPAPASSLSGWMDEFHKLAQARGCRIDFYGAHCYLDPFPEALIGYLSKIHELWGKPVWLTEFAGFDTSGFGNYTEEQHYRFLCEFLWRTEDLPWLQRYSIFPFYIDPAPHPWDPVPDRRSAMFNAAGTSMTSLGELYAAWDADRTMRPGKAYFIFNKATSFKLSHTGASSLATSDIRASDTTAQWAMVPASGTDHYYITSMWDGGRLAWTGENLEMVAGNVTGATVEWKWSADPSDKYGYYFIDHPASGNRLRMDRTPEKGAPVSVTLSMDKAGTTIDQTRWHFIKPVRPGNLDGPMGLQAAAGDGRVYLKWKSLSDSTAYEVKRSTDPDGQFKTIATVSEGRYEDAGVANGITYHYVISKAGLEDSNSAAVTVIAGWLANPGFESPSTGDFKINPPGASWSFNPPHDSDQTGISPNGSGYTNANPVAPQGAQVAFLQGKGKISQTLSGLVPGKKYQVSFLAAQRGSFQTNGQTWNLTVDGSVIGSFEPPQEGVRYIAYSSTFVASGSIQLLSFIGTNTRGGDNTVLIDDVRISLMPRQNEQ